MDPEAVIQASESDLKFLGLEKMGDILAVKTFADKCITQDDKDKKRSEMKRDLLRLCLSEHGKRKKVAPSKSVSVKGDVKLEKTRSISVGWMHFCQAKQRYISVRLARGGGSRNLAVPLSSTVSDLKKKMKTLFFPDGRSTYGEEDDMLFNLGNFKGEIICDHFFTLAKYIQENQLSKVRLYLLSQCFDDTDSDSDLSESVLKVDSPRMDRNKIQGNEIICSAGPSSEQGTASIFEPAASEVVATINVDSGSSSLIGSSAERSALRKEQDQLYLESLADYQQLSKEIINNW